jgi:xanthine dehydrogenase accessory factor
MKEPSEIVAAFEALCAAGQSAALATVIAVEGSAYRRPGARMLVSPDGRTWGGISGGCLERDVARRGLGVIETGRPVRCRYDTGDEDAVAAGTSTGCGGTVELFIQPVSADAPGPIPFFARVLSSRKPITISTVLRAAGANSVGRAGQCECIDGMTLGYSGQLWRTPAPTPGTPGKGWGGGFHSEDDIDESPPDLPRSTGGGERTAYPPQLGVPLATPSHGRASPGIAGDTITEEYFVERLLPPQALVVFGSGPDAVPVVSIAKTLGWHVTVIGSRPATGIFERFGAANAIHITPSDDPFQGVAIPSDAAVVMMTHNLARDSAILARLHGPLAYLGILGPRHRTRQLLAELPDGRVRGISQGRLFAPVGLDLGAQTPEEIALAVIAEIQSVVRRASGRSLRVCPGPLHRNTSAIEAAVETNCPDDHPVAVDTARRSPACPA